MRNFVVFLCVTTAAGLIAYTGLALVQPFTPEVEALTANLGITLLLISTTVLVGLIVAGRGTLLALRRAWFLIGIAALMKCVAAGIDIFSSRIFQVTAHPLLAESFSLVFYPLLLSGILLFPYIPLQGGRRTLVTLDTSIVILVASLFGWYFLVTPLQNEVLSLSSGLLTFTAPVAVIIIMIGLHSLTRREIQNVSRALLLFLSASLLFIITADSVSAILDAYKIPHSMFLINLLWMLAFWFLLMSAGWQILYPEEETVEYKSLHPLIQNALPLIATAMAMVMAIISALRLMTLDLRAYGLFLGLLAFGILILVRQYVALIESQRLYKNLEQIAVTDALTNVYNRHYFNTAIEREIRRAGRYKRCLSLLLIDIDNFKSFNDRHGHLEGDILLKNISAQLGNCIRGTDILARFGGDEFVALLPEASIEDAQDVAQKLKNIIATNFAYDNLGVSIGIAIYQPGATAQSILNDADRELYADKRSKLKIASKP